MKETIHGTVAAYREAHRLIWGGGLWRWLGVPVALTVLYFPLMVGGAIWFALWSSGKLSEYFPALAGLHGVGRVLVGIVVFGGLAVVGYVTYRGVVMIFYSPFLDRISRRVERSFGHECGIDVGRVQMLRRVALMTLATVGSSLVVGALGLVVGLLPIIGWGLTVLVFLPLQLFISGIGFIDPYLDRNGYSARESLGLLFRRFWRVLAFSAVGSLIMLIPLFGWFVGPTYAVVAGVIVGLDIDERRLAAGEADPPAA